MADHRSACILIIDDEVRHCRSLDDYLTRAGHTVHIAGSAERGLEIIRENSIDVVLLDIRLPGMDGLSVVPQLRQFAPAAPIVIMTAFGTLDTAVKAVQAEVFDYLVKPFSLQELKAVLARAFENQVTSAGSKTSAPNGSPEEMVIGRSPAMQRIFNRIALVAASDVPVLLTGESGTGKEVLAKAIHRNSARAQGRFLPVLMASLSPGLVESELFGHVRGAYTGADIPRTGLLEQAAGGTVLLDELGDIPMSLQVKILRALEQREVTRVGDDELRPINVRFIAATNKCLPELIARDEFRGDLFYRLSVYHIEIPPLRDRTEDIPELAEYFLQRIVTQTQCTGIAPAAMRELESRPWYGNIRELRNAVEHAAIASRGGMISIDHLPAAIPGIQSERQQANWQDALANWVNEHLSGLNPMKDHAQLHDDLLSEVEPRLIELVLEKCRRNQAASARMLGIDPKTLKSKIASKME